MFGLSPLTWIAIIVLVVAIIIKIIIMRFEKASKKQAEKIIEESKTLPTLGINVGENIDSKDKLA